MSEEEWVKETALQCVVKNRREISEGSWEVVVSGSRAVEIFKELIFPFHMV